MPFVPKKQAFNAHINEVVLGVGDKATAIGGQNVLPFHTFDAEIKNAPKIGVELTDLGMAEYTMPGEKAFYAGCTTVAEMAKRAETLEGASFICLHLEGADPNGLNKSVEECVQLAKDVADATTLPLVIMGCKNIEKDTELFNKISEALAGKNILVLSARDEDYKTVVASAGMAYGQKVGAESAADINLANAETLMVTMISKEHILRRILTEDVVGAYDFVLIDCLPSLGTLLINALTAADRVLIPVQTQKFSMDGLQSLEALTQLVKANTNPKLNLIGVLPTMVDRTKVSRTAIETLNEKYGEMLFRTSISKSIEAAKSSENGTPLCLTGHKLGQEYDELAQEVLSRC